MLSIKIRQTHFLLEDNKKVEVKADTDAKRGHRLNLNNLYLTMFMLLRH